MGEFIEAEAVTTSLNKKFYINLDLWLEGRLDVNGNLKAKEVMVDVSNAPDYVFKTDYDHSNLHKVDA
ncbi:hypothetical protein [Leeuwenhoekiella sp. H156]|uniref:hypothetical protein n=1 Tax=Leeuwenhoekiella sp. H156 TaxID=3450128 RepID=UPI003FA47CA6